MDFPKEEEKKPRSDLSLNLSLEEKLMRKTVINKRSRNKF